MALDQEAHSQELMHIVEAVKSYNSKWNAVDRPTRLTLLLAVGDEPIALLAGPPIRNSAPVGGRPQ
jgi:hypothetical protein